MVLSQFYLSVMQRLQAANIGIQFIDWFNDQFNQEQAELPFNLPAVFLEYEPIVWQTLGNKRQAADITFKLHVASDMVYLETSSLETTTERNAALLHMELLDNIKYWLHGFSGTLAASTGLLCGSFGAIRPAGVDPDQNHGSVLIHVMTFMVRITDDSSRHKTQKVTPAPQLVITTSVEGSV